VFVNGNFDDWKKANIYSDQANDQTVNPEINIVKFGALRDGKYLSFYVKVEGRMMGGRSLGMDSLSIYIDGDKNYGTGYHIGNLGADYLLRLEGYDGKVPTKNFWKFNTSRTDQSDYNAFSKGIRVSAEADATQIEAQGNMADMSITKDTPIACLVIMEDKDGNTDSSFVFSDKKGALVTTLTFTASGSVTKGQSNAELARLTFQAFGLPANVPSVALSIKGTARGTDFSKVSLAPEAGGTSYSGTASGTAMTFDTGALQVPKDASIVLKVMADISASANAGSTIGLVFAGSNAVTTDAVALTLDASPSKNIYIDKAQSRIVIDGAFDDWALITGMLDPAKDTPNKNIDLREVKTDSDANNLYFYFRVDGKVMMGTNSPRALVRPAGGPGGNPGPAPELPPLNGGDAAYIFIDNDSKASTGYAIDGIGADYLLQVMGRNGVVESSSYLSFNGGKNQGLWSWTKVKVIEAQNDATQVECSVNAVSVGVDKQYMAVVQMTDWEKHTDTLDEVIVGMGGNRSLPADHPDVIRLKDLNPDGPLHAPEFGDIAIPMAGTIVIVVAIRYRRRKAQK
jgi:hypothetical protein